MPAVLCNPIIFWPYFFSLTNTVRETEQDPDFKGGIVQQGLVSRPPQKTKTNIKPAAASQTQPPSAGLALEEILLLVALAFFFSYWLLMFLRTISMKLSLLSRFA